MQPQLGKELQKQDTFLSHMILILSDVFICLPIWLCDSISALSINLFSLDNLIKNADLVHSFFVGDIICTRRCGQLCGPTYSSCGGLRPACLFIQFQPFLGHFLWSVVTIITLRKVERLNFFFLIQKFQTNTKKNF